MSFDEEWSSARKAAADRVGMRLNSADAGSPGGKGDLKVTESELSGVGHEAHKLFDGINVDAFHAGAQHGTAADSLHADGFKTGAAMWTAWNTWRDQSETLVSACAHIANHLESTAKSHKDFEGELVTNFSVSLINEHFS